MDDPASQTGLVNLFSLVSYIPGPLGEFITNLRQELVPQCTAQSHVTILPPRPISVTPAEAEGDLRSRLEPYGPFRIHLPELRVFEKSAVIFVHVGDGREELFDLHTALSTGPFEFQERFEYHPHITLAQGVAPDQVAALFEYASERWAEAPSRSCMVETLTFVQNAGDDRWIDLAECELRGAVAVSR